MAYAVVITGQAKIEANALGVTDVQVAIGSGGKRVSTRPFHLPVLIVFFDDTSDEIGNGAAGRPACRVVFQINLSLFIHYAYFYLL